MSRGPDVSSRPETLAWPRRVCTYAVVLAVCAMWMAVAPSIVSGQAMPDPAMMHGRAIPARELPDGTVTVRVVRKALGNNVTGQQVSVTAGSAIRTATTDAEGRAQFGDLPKGTSARATVTVDGEVLTSQPFAVPTSGGLRVILVAGLPAAGSSEAGGGVPAAPAVPGTVTFGGNTRVVMQFQDDTLQVFYLLEIINGGTTPVNPGRPLVLDLPGGARSAAVLEGSSPAARVNGDRVTITGPFAPGTTTVQLGYRMDHHSPEMALIQTFPAALEEVVVAAQKVGSMALSSPQLTTTREVSAADGTPLLFGSGGGLPAGGTLTLNLSNLPVHSRVPRYAALGLALGIVLLGVWLAVSRKEPASARPARLARRDRLLGELEALEIRHQNGTVSARRYETRRGQIVSELEQIYADLDEASAGPQGGGEGLAA